MRADPKTYDLRPRLWLLILTEAFIEIRSISVLRSCVSWNFLCNLIKNGSISVIMIMIKN